MSYRVDVVTETMFHCDAPDCLESIISTWVPHTSAVSDVLERGWVTKLEGELSFCPVHGLRGQHD